MLTRTIPHQPKSSISCYRCPHARQLLDKGDHLKKAFPAGFGSTKNLAFRLLGAWRNAWLLRRLSRKCHADVSGLDSTLILPSEPSPSTPSRIPHNKESLLQPLSQPDCSPMRSGLRAQHYARSSRCIPLTSSLGSSLLNSLDETGLAIGEG
jgi:hypothetical protein